MHKCLGIWLKKRFYDKKSWSKKGPKMRKNVQTIEKKSKVGGEF